MKKEHEVQEFAVAWQFDPVLDAQAADLFFDALVDSAQSRGLTFGGGGGPWGGSGFVCKAKRGSATEEDRAAIAEWFRARTGTVRDGRAARRRLAGATPGHECAGVGRARRRGHHHAAGAGVGGSMSLHATSVFVWTFLTLGAVFALLLAVGAAVGLWAFFRRLLGRGGFRGVSAEAAAAPLPGEIMAALDAVPPLERPRAAKRYRGMPVRWRVCYDSALSPSRTTVCLMSTEWGTDYPWLFFNVSPRRYPQLRTLLKSAPLWVSGRVKEVRLNDIYLEKVSLGSDA